MIDDDDDNGDDDDDDDDGNDDENERPVMKLRDNETALHYKTATITTFSHFPFVYFHF